MEKGEKIENIGGKNCILPRKPYFYYSQISKSNFKKLRGENIVQIICPYEAPHIL